MGDVFIIYFVKLWIIVVSCCLGNIFNGYGDVLMKLRKGVKNIGYII